MNEVDAVEDISMEEVLGPKKNYSEEQIKEAAEKVKECRSTLFITDRELKAEVIHHLDYGLTFGQLLARLVSDLDDFADYCDNDANEDYYEYEDSPEVKAVRTAINNVPVNDRVNLDIMLCRVLARRLTLK